MDRLRYWIGHRSGFREGFETRGDKTPTKRSHPQYNAVVGPFDTKRGREWALKHPNGWVHVNEAEKRAKRS